MHLNAPHVPAAESDAAHTDAAPNVSELTAEGFSNVCYLLGAQPTTPDDADQRRQPRQVVNSRATIIPLRESAHPGPLAILVRDLSPAGIGFLHEQPMNLDEEFCLVLPRANDTPALILCAVACWQPVARQVYAVGARYVRVLRDGGDPALPIVTAPELTPSTSLPTVRAKAS